MLKGYRQKETSSFLKPQLTTNPVTVLWGFTSIVFNSLLCVILRETHTKQMKIERIKEESQK